MYKLDSLQSMLDGGDFVLDFEVDGVPCTFAWDPECLLNDLLNGRDKEEILENYSSL